jgi:hypothetical protein
VTCVDLKWNYPYLITKWRLMEQSYSYRLRIHSSTSYTTIVFGVTLNLKIHFYYIFSVRDRKWSDYVQNVIIFKAIHTTYASNIHLIAGVCTTVIRNMHNTIAVINITFLHNYTYSSRRKKVNAKCSLRCRCSTLEILMLYPRALFT